MLNISVPLNLSKVHSKLKELRLTFLPETALRRTPSSLSRLRNCYRCMITVRLMKTKRAKGRNQIKIHYTAIYLRKLYRAAIPLVLLLLYIAPIANKARAINKIQANQPSTQTSCPRPQLQFSKSQP